MKAKKTYKAKIKANPGLKMNPWEVDQNPTVYNQYDAKFPYPVDYYPNIPGSSKNKIDAATGKPTYFQNRQDIVNPWNQDYSGGNQPDFSGAEIADGQPMDMSFKPYDPSNSGYGLPLSAGNSESSKGPSNGSKFGSMAQGIGRAAGQALNALTVGGPQLINALLPDQQLEREDRTIPRALNQYPQGINNSQAIYKNGGYVERTRRAGKKGRIQVTEEVPEYQDTFQPMQQSQNVPYSFAPKQVPQPMVPEMRDISYETLYDVNRQPTGYAPQFSGFSFNEASQALNQLPQDFGGLPVTRGIEEYQALYPNFRPNTRSSQWMPNIQEDYYPQPMSPFKNGGKVEPVKTNNPNDPRLQAYNDSLELHNLSRKYLETEYRDKNGLNIDDPNMYLPWGDRGVYYGEPSLMDPINKKINDIYNKTGYSPEKYIPTDGTPPQWKKPAQSIEFSPQTRAMEQLPVNTEVPEFNKVGRMVNAAYSYERGSGLGYRRESGYRPKYQEYQNGGVLPTANPTPIGPNATKNYPFMPNYKCGGKMKKGYKNGGYVEGDEVDLSPEEVRELIAQGYEIDIL